MTMSNPNKCSTCDHKRHPDGGHCYMFRDEPSDVCMQHTGRKVSITDLLPPERECCGTLYGSHHRATCAKYSGKFKPANAKLSGPEGAQRP